MTSWEWWVSKKSKVWKKHTYHNEKVGSEKGLLSHEAQTRPCYTKSVVQFIYDPRGGLHWSHLQWSHPYIWACTGGSICRACRKCELRESRELRCTLFQDMRHRLCLPMASAGWEEGLWVIESCGSCRGMAAQRWVTWLKEERAWWSLFLLRNIGVWAGIVWEEQEACNWALYLSETYLTV